MKDSKKITIKMRNEAITGILRAMFKTRYEDFQRAGDVLAREIWSVSIGADAINTLKQLETVTGHKLVIHYNEIECSFYNTDVHPAEMTSRFSVYKESGGWQGYKYSWVENLDISTDWLPEGLNIRKLKLNGHPLGMPYGKSFFSAESLTAAQRRKFQKKLEQRSKDFREYIQELRLTHDHLQQVICACKTVGDLKRYMPRALDYLPVEVRAPQYPVPVVLANDLNDAIP